MIGLMERGSSSFCLPLWDREKGPSWSSLTSLGPPPITPNDRTCSSNLIEKRRGRGPIAANPAKAYRASLGSLVTYTHRHLHFQIPFAPLFSSYLPSPPQFPDHRRYTTTLSVKPTDDHKHHTMDPPRPRPIRSQTSNQNQGIRVAGAGGTGTTRSGESALFDSLCYMIDISSRKLI